MKPEQLSISPAIIRRAGLAAVTRTCALLWPEGDCQSCVSPLRPGKIVLWVDELDDTYALASLHHDTCRDSRWNDSSVYVAAQQAGTYSFSKWLIGTHDGKEMPVFGLNPRLETVKLAREPGGQWKPVLPEEFTRMISSEKRPVEGLREPLTDGVYCTIRGTCIYVHFPDGLVYPTPGSETDDPQQLRDQLSIQGSALLAVTQAANTHAIKDDIEAIMRMVNHTETVTFSVPLAVPR